MVLSVLRLKPMQNKPVTGQESPHSELPQLSYKGFEHEVGDERTPSLLPERRTLHDSDISLRNLDPETICAYIQQGTLISLRRSLWDEAPLIILFFFSIGLIVYLTGKI